VLAVTGVGVTGALSSSAGFGTGALTTTSKKPIPLEVSGECVRCSVGVKVSVGGEPVDGCNGNGAVAGVLLDVFEDELSGVVMGVLAEASFFRLAY
jgi:hypothetical protein